MPLSDCTVFIVGAGFSRYAGLPLQVDFTRALLEPSRADSASKPLVAVLRKFIARVFDHEETAGSKYWPPLEDVFTCIDMSANTGHHLGVTDSPSDLRTVRRMLLSRMMWMLEEHYAAAAIDKNPDWNLLDRFFRRIDLDRAAFVSINWDTVIERRLSETRGIFAFDYGCGALAARIPDEGLDGCVETVRPMPNAPRAKIIKMHGSVNWLYCDNCRRLYWFPTHQAQPVARQLISEEEAQLLGFPESCWSAWKCPQCVEVRLTTRVATFSLLKALDFPMFQKSWSSAERLLRESKKWVFIGYSLPLADFEFKYLLKRVQLARSSPEFVVITGGTPEQADATYRNYQRFFGRSIRRRFNFFDQGLSSDAVQLAVE
jgi:hypothetical protein